MKTSGLGRFSLGQPVPARTHAVCVSLPRVEDLIGYEEKDPKTLGSMPTGYPRFVRHPMIERMIKRLSHEQSGKRGYLFSRAEDCAEVIDTYGIEDARVIECQTHTLLELSAAAAANALVSSYFQHTGCGISSRLAEDFLWEQGLLENREVVSESDDPESRIKEVISRSHGPEVGVHDLILASSGANAFHALFKSAVKRANRRGKSIWIRLGWLYLDTIEAMKLHSSKDGKVLEILEVANAGMIKNVFDEHGDRIAGVVTEFPTNPLLQSGDLQLIRELCDQNQSLLVIDPTMVSPKNARITGIADVVVNSLTKYAGWEGDVMMGSLAFPRSSSAGRELFEEVSGVVCPPYRGDLLRLAEQVPFYEDFIDRSNASSMEVAQFLLRHPAVKKVHWAYQDGFARNYERFAGGDHPGCTLSFETKHDFERFYNRLAMLKSPSFGTEFSNCCPYVYLAHYPLIQSDQGRKSLRAAGISPELFRLSVGLEPVGEIIDTLDRALK